MGCKVDRLSASMTVLAMMLAAGNASAQEASAAPAATPAPTTPAGATDAAGATQTAPTTPESAPTAGDGQLGDIIVTAEKRPENLQRTPAAITAISGAALAAQGITDVMAVQVRVPSVEFVTDGANTQLFIRGIGAFLDTASITPLVSYNVDGLTVPREGTANRLFDVAQIEVLKGPQGTLYGRSTAGGAIVITNNRPTDQLATTGLVEVGNYEGAHGTLVGNVPLTDTLAVRAAVDFLHHDGYQKSGADNSDDGSVRLSGLWRPSSDFSAYVWGQYSSKNGVSNNMTHPYINGDPWNDLTADGKVVFNPAGPTDLKNRTKMVGGEFTYQLENMSIVYIPTYVNIDSRERELSGQLGNFQDRFAKIYAYSQELKLLSASSSKLKWIVGAYWYKQHYNYAFRFNTFNAFDTPDVNERAYVIYGQLTYPVTDRFRVTAGGRYQNARKDAVGFNPDPTVDITGRAFRFTFDRTWNPVDWKAGVEYDVGPAAMLYFTAQSGWGMGTFNNFASTPTLSNAIDPSKLISYTGGLKSRFFDNRLQFNLEGYYYDYKNLVLQAYDGTSGISRLFNAHRSEIYGAEADVRAQVTDNDQIYAAIGYLSAKPTDFVVGTTSYNGLQLGYSPSVTISGGISHNWELASGARITGAVDSRYESGYWLGFEHLPGTRQNAFTKTDASLTYFAPSGKWNLGLWVKNIENVDTWAAGAAAGNGTIIANVLAPRTYGARLAFKY